MSEPQVSAAPMPFRLVLAEAMRWTRRYFRVLYPPIAVPLAFIVTVIDSVAVSMRTAGATEGQAGGARLGAWVLVRLLALPVVGLAQCALQVAAVDAVAGRGPKMALAWRFIVQPRALGTLTLILLCYITSFAACFFPLFYLSSLLAFVVPAMVDEGRFGVDALDRSCELTRFNPERRVLSSPIVQVLAVSVLELALDGAIHFGVAKPLMAEMMGISSGPTSAPTIVHLISLLLETAVSVYFSFVIALLFFEVRRRRETADLGAALDAMLPSPA